MIRARFADDVVGAVFVSGGGGFAGGAEGDGGEATVAFLGVGLAAEEGHPVEGAAFVGVEAEPGEGVEGLGTALVVEGAEEGVFAVVEP